jgi:hypothetical protein
MTINSVLIRGDGVAARCCGHLLRQAGYRVSFEASGRQRVPVIMLSVAAQSLLRDVFQRDDLFLDLPVIRKRVVAWGSGEPRELDHSAVVISEEQLLDRLGMVSEKGAARWTIYASPPLPESTVEHRFGSRMATAVKVEMKSSDACWIESVEDGWLFLNSGWLLAAGAGAEELLQQSRLVRGQIHGWSVSARFPASPRMVTPHGAAGWICCGSAAMAFDPLCGDGTAHAVREAILASAVIRAVDGGEDFGDLMAHYEGRLSYGFQRHLRQCYLFYCHGGGGPWWRSQQESLAQGLLWNGSKLDGRGVSNYQLIGFELKRR